jgi:HEAT repeat protein
LYCAGRSEEDIRYAAIKVLGELARPEALALLVEKLRDPSPEVRAVTIEALAQYRDASLVPRLIPFLEENDGMLDAEAALALGRIGNAALAEPLMKLLSSPHERTRAAAATALALLP